MRIGLCCEEAPPEYMNFHPDSIKLHDQVGRVMKTDHVYRAVVNEKTNMITFDFDSVSNTIKESVVIYTDEEYTLHMVGEIETTALDPELLTFKCRLFPVSRFINPPTAAH